LEEILKIPEQEHKDPRIRDGDSRFRNQKKKREGGRPVWKKKKNSGGTSNSQGGCGGSKESVNERNQKRRLGKGRKGMGPVERPVSENAPIKSRPHMKGLKIGR